MLGLDAALALIEASYRMYVAEHLALNETAKAMAALRAVTVLSWLEVARVSATPLVGFEALEEADRVLGSYVDAVVDYVRAVTGFDPREVRMADGRTVGEWLKDALIYSLSGNHVRSLALRLAVLERLDEALALSTMGAREALQCYRRLFSDLYSVAVDRGVMVQVPLLYHEYSVTLEESDPGLAAVMEAAAASRLLLALALTMPASTATPAAEPVTVAAEGLAVAALASLALGVSLALIASRYEVEYGLRPSP